MTKLLNNLNDATTAYCCDEMFDAGRKPFDSDHQIGLLAYVEVETPDGFRFRNNRVFKTSHWDLDAEGFGGWVNRIEHDLDHAQHLADRVNAHLARGGKLDRQHWYPVQGAYGSKAYDEQAELERERQEELDF